MKKKKSIHPFNWKTALVLSVVITLILNVLTVFTSIEISRVVNKEMDELFVNIALNSVMNVITFFLLYMFAFRVIQAPLKPCMKVLTMILGMILFTAVLSLISSSIRISLKTSEYLELIILFTLLRDLVVAIIVLLSTSQIHTMYLRQQTLVENEKLASENVRNRYEALKNQVDPHFLFNSLNTLNGLIGYDDARAHEYVEKLSSVFRYTIQNKEVITLQDELGFVDSYCYLMKIRYGNNLRIESNIEEKYYSYYVMPICLQLQVENAIKHNVISNKYPLLIKMYTTPNNTLVVENNIQPKTLPIASTGIGLANLTERYKLLSNKEVIISNSNNIFRVEIPLIKVEN